jgi:hypothetical protein
MSASVQLGRLPGQVIAALYLGLFPLVGLIVAYIGFCDPDTCWHLAMGKWICLHNQLPLADPFSTNINDYVRTGKGQPIMQHEWLSDCIFYCLYAWGGAKLLLMSVAALASLALIISPSLLMFKSGASRFVSLLATITVLPACMFRLWVRPEIFSFTYMAALIWLVELGRHATKRAFFICLFGIFALLSLWANCHALFVMGLFYLGLYTVLSLVQFVFAHYGRLTTDALAVGRSLGRLVAMTAAGIVGTLCTPWSINLWLYVSNIVLSPQAHGNKENGPLDVYSMGHITVIPLVISFLLVAFLFVRAVGGTDKKDSDRACFFALNKIVLALGLYLSALAIAVFFRRLTPFALIILLSSLALLFERVGRRECANESAVIARDDIENKSLKSEVPANWLNAGQEQLEQLNIPGWQSSVVGVLLAMTTVWSATTYLLKPEIPSASRFFVPAWQALDFLSKQRPQGRMLNDSKLGSMMPFCMPLPPDIFIDGRFDSYNRQLIDDYQEMRLAKPGYGQLLSRYKIDWVFFPPRTPIVERLRQDPLWHVYYQDSAAVVLSRDAR